MVALIFFLLNLGASLFKPKSWLAAENAALRQQLIVLQRQLRGRAQFTNSETLDQSSDDVLTLTAPAQLKRFGREMRLLVNGSDDQAAADPSLLRIIVHAHDIQRRLSQNTSLTVHDIAREEGVTAAYLYNLLRLPWLAPDITTAIVNGQHEHHPQGAEKGQTANIKQNTTNKGFFHGRRFDK